MVKWERAVKYFEALNYKREANDCSEWLTYVRMGRPSVFIGKNGNIRIGEEFEHSINVTDSYWVTIRIWELQEELNGKEKGTA